MAERAWYFVHVPKTAGTAVRRYLEESFARDEVLFVYPGDPSRYGPHVMPLEEVAKLPPEELFRYRVLYGHFPFRPEWVLHEHGRGLAFVRDPAARVISWFHYMRSSGATHGTERGERIHAAINERGLSLPELFDELGGIRELDNGIVRYLAGGHGWPVGAIGDQQLQAAIDHVEKHFEFVGHAGHFDESMQRLARIFGRPYRRRRRVNAAAEGPAERHVAAFPRDFLDRVTGVDREFVEWVERRFFGR